MLEKIKAWSVGGGAIRGLLPVVLILAGVLLALWPQGSRKAVSEAAEEWDYSAYRLELKQQLEQLLSSVDGVGEVEVMLTLETGSEQVYACDAQSSYDQNGSALSGSSLRETVLIGEGEQGKTPVLLYEQMPRVRGVAVVCDGGRDPAVCLRITQLISSLFGIRAGSVSVIH